MLAPGAVSSIRVRPVGQNEVSINADELATVGDLKQELCARGELEGLFALAADGVELEDSDALPRGDDNEFAPVDLTYSSEINGGGKGAGLIEIRKNWQSDVFWLKCCFDGQGCVCDKGLDGLIKPINAGQMCCLASECGFRKSGAVLNCFPHCINEDWCTNKCLCINSYCGVPCMTESTKAWFQICCIQVNKTVEFKMVPFGSWKKELCWIRCCCEGTGLECPDLQSLVSPVEKGVFCCIESQCGLYKGPWAKCFPDLIKSPWCKEKCCCIQTYCGIGPCLANPLQLCCVEVQTSMGSSFDKNFGDCSMG